MFDELKKVKYFKGAIKLYFMRLSRVVIILLNAGLSRSAFSSYSFRKLVVVAFLCFLCFLLVLYFEFNGTICINIIYISSKCFMLSFFTLLFVKTKTYYKKSIITYSKIMLPERIWAFFKKCIYKKKCGSHKKKEERCKKGNHKSNYFRTFSKSIIQQPVLNF